MPTTLQELDKEYIPTHWETPNCPFCGEVSFHLIERFGPDHRYHSVECDSCSLAYMNPRPRYDEEFLRIAYDSYADNDEVFNKFKQQILKSPDAHESDVRLTIEDLNPSDVAMLKENMDVVRFFEERYGRKGRFLDVGCATGFMCLAAVERGWSAVGIDISKPMVEFMTKVLGITGFAGQYHQTREVAQEGPFDVIYCSHVIEHIPNPNDWCEKFSEQLAEGGILCLQVPANNSPERRIKRILKRLGLKKDDWKLWRTPDHLYEPSIGPVKALLARHGLKIVDWETYSRKDLLNQSFLSKLRHRWLKAGNNLRIIAQKS